MSLESIVQKSLGLCTCMAIIVVHDYMMVIRTFVVKPNNSHTQCSTGFTKLAPFSLLITLPEPERHRRVIPESSPCPVRFSELELELAEPKRTAPNVWTDGFFSWCFGTTGSTRSGNPVPNGKKTVLVVPMWQDLHGKWLRGWESIQACTLRHVLLPSRSPVGNLTGRTMTWRSYT